MRCMRLRYSASPDLERPLRLNLMIFLYIAQTLCLAIAVLGSIYAILCLAAAAVFRERMKHGARASAFPPVTIFKPLYGADKDLHENLRSACLQDYPQYQVILSVQRLDDPAIPVMRAVLQEFGEERVTLAIASSEARTNGKIQNLEIALPFARHDLLVISDSDIRLRADYLRAVVAPLADPDVGLRIHALSRRERATLVRKARIADDECRVRSESDFCVGCGYRQLRTGRIDVLSPQAISKRSAGLRHSAIFWRKTSTSPRASKRWAGGWCLHRISSTWKST